MPLSFILITLQIVMPKKHGKARMFAVYSKLIIDALAALLRRNELTFFRKRK